jgi:hypothetical protein
MALRCQQSLHTAPSLLSDQLQIGDRLSQNCAGPLTTSRPYLPRPPARPIAHQRLLEEQEARVAQLEAANTSAAERIAAHEATIERTQQEQQAAVAALSDRVKHLLQQGRALLRQGATPSPERDGGRGIGGGGSRPGSTAGEPPVLDPSVEEFMEATSGCLQLHERRLDDLAAAVPAVQAAVREREQLASLQRQISALETMLAVMTGARPGAAGALMPPPRPVPQLSCGPLSALPALQQAIASLGTEFDRMRAAMVAEVGRIRADAEADRADRAEARARAAATAEAAMRREAELRTEMAEREERLLQIRCGVGPL